MSAIAGELAWDYSALARHYDYRAPYAPDTVATILRETGKGRGATAIDIGAGTGRLSAMLALAGLHVQAVEPNAAMREIGQAKTNSQDVVWSDATGESTRIVGGAAALVCFGSSFNVLDRGAALREASRILQRNGWIACLWNHRDLDDPIQRKIETVIRHRLPGYSLGTRREDPSDVIRESGLFDATRNFKCSFVHHSSRDVFVAGFRAHATLVGQAGNQLDAILDDIARTLPVLVNVPFSTRIWIAQKLHG